MNRLHTSEPAALARALVVGLYAWLVAVSFGLSWNSRATRNLLAASLVTVLVVPFAALLILAPLSQQSSVTGSAIRLSIFGVASVLAFAGFRTARP